MTSGVHMLYNYIIKIQFEKLEQINPKKLEDSEDERI